MLTSSAFAGNEYTIIVAAVTNRPDWPECDEYGEIPRRVHIELSLDGGETFPRKIAYGVPVITNTIQYTYSLPWWDSSLITESAIIRVTDLEGEGLGRSSSQFTIAGVFWTTPAALSTLTHGSYVDLSWTQAGVGPSAELGYITPSSGFTSVATFSNLVAGANSLSWQVSGLPYPEEQIRLVLRSVSDPLVWGASAILETD
jgi:hypothetical protein